MEQTPALRARRINKSFGDVVALDGVDLDIMAGQIHGLVGPNGAGKTTLLGLLLGLSVADSGELELLGTRIGRTPAVPEGVAGFVDEPGLYPSLTPRQNLAMVAGLRRHRTDDIDDVLDRVGLADVADDRVHGFSLGMRQRLGLAAALLTRPRLLVLDEPANGLDPAGSRQVHRLLTEVAADGTAVVLSSHRMDHLAALCTEVTLLVAGRVAFCGPVSKLAAQTGELDYRLRVSHPARARRVATGTTDLRLVPANDRVRDPDGPTDDDQPLIVRGSVPALDGLIVGLVGAGIAVREFVPVVAPLEAAFLALTGDDGDPASTHPTSIGPVIR